MTPGGVPRGAGDPEASDAARQAAHCTRLAAGDILAPSGEGTQVWDVIEPTEGTGGPSLYDGRVLVAVVPTARDWERIQHEGWYRIPLARAPQRLGAEYLAFYHTKDGGELRWTISHYGRCMTCLGAAANSSMSRTIHADDLYYRRAGMLEPCPAPSQPQAPPQTFIAALRRCSALGSMTSGSGGATRPPLAALQARGRRARLCRGDGPRAASSTWRWGAGRSWRSTEVPRRGTPGGARRGARRCSCATWGLSAALEACVEQVLAAIAACGGGAMERTARRVRAISRPGAPGARLCAVH